MEYTSFLGWDCANKSLAWSHVTIDLGAKNKISAELATMRRVMDEYAEGIINNSIEIDAAFLNGILESQNRLKHICNNFIIFHSWGVVDVIHGKKIKDTTEIERSKCLYNWLKSSPVSISKVDSKTLVIIEHQPSKIGSKTNNKSTMVSHQLMFYYAERDSVIVNPKLKNKITLSDDLKYVDYVNRLKARRKDPKGAIYTARKQHSRDSFIYLLKILGKDHVLADIPKKNLDDLADSFIQILAYLSQ